MTLVKVKHHTGCLLNEHADELAELGPQAEEPEICPGPQKYVSFWLQVRPTTRSFAERSTKTLPRDSAPNRSLFEELMASNTFLAVKPDIADVAGVETTDQKRKCWGSSISTNEWVSDNLDQGPAKQQLHVTDGQADALWTRLQQLEPQRKRRS